MLSLTFNVLGAPVETPSYATHPQWIEYKSMFNKTYAGPEEEQSRFSAFLGPSPSDTTRLLSPPAESHVAAAAPCRQPGTDRAA